MKEKLVSSEGIVVPARRQFIGGVGKASLSAVAVALMMGCESMARGTSVSERREVAANPGQDVSILNVALALEHEAINAYQLGAESGLLQKPVLDVAVLFQSHHKAHRDALAGTIRMLGGSPVDQESLEHYAKALNAGSLKTQGDVLGLAAKLEKGAANAYLGVIPAFSDPELSKISGRLAADETLHWTVLSQALGQPVPQEALSFGA